MARLVALTVVAAVVLLVIVLPMDPARAAQERPPEQAVRNEPLELPTGRLTAELSQAAAAAPGRSPSGIATSSPSPTMRAIRWPSRTDSPASPG